MLGFVTKTHWQPMSLSWQSVFEAAPDEPDEPVLDGSTEQLASHDVFTQEAIDATPLGDDVTPLDVGRLA